MADHKVKTLLCLLYGLQGRETTIDLRNEVIVTGTISDVDKRMKYECSASRGVSMYWDESH